MSPSIALGAAQQFRVRRLLHQCDEQELFRRVKVGKQCARETRSWTRRSQRRTQRMCLREDGTEKSEASQRISSSNSSSSSSTDSSNSSSSLIAACSAVAGLSLAAIMRVQGGSSDESFVTTDAASGTGSAPLIASVSMNGTQGKMIAPTTVSVIEQYDTSLANTQPTMLEFYADWCSVCRGMQGDITRLRRTNEDINIIQINVENMAFAEELAKYKVRGVPHFVFLDGNNNDVGEVIGNMTLDELHENVVALKLEKELPIVTNFSTANRRAISMNDDNSGNIFKTKASSDPKAHG